MIIPDEVRELFDRPNFVHVATLTPRGGPHVVAVWATTLGEDRVAFFTQPGSFKARNLERDGRVAMSVVDHDQPYRTASLQGHLVETLDGEPALEVMDLLSVRHTGKPFPMRTGRVFVFEVDNARSMTLPFERHPTAV